MAGPYCDETKSRAPGLWIPGSWAPRAWRRGPRPSFLSFGVLGPFFSIPGFPKLGGSPGPFFRSELQLNVSHEPYRAFHSPPRPGLTLLKKAFKGPDSHHTAKPKGFSFRRRAAARYPCLHARPEIQFNRRRMRWESGFWQ